MIDTLNVLGKLAMIGKWRLGLVVQRQDGQITGDKIKMKTSQIVCHSSQPCRVSVCIT